MLTLVPKELTSQRIDAAWHLISQMTFTNVVNTFSMVASVATGILVIFHSNADCEGRSALSGKTKQNSGQLCQPGC